MIDKETAYLIAEYIGAFIGCFLSGFICFLLGSFFERMRWNKLIEEGKLPKPSKKDEN